MKRATEPFASRLFYWSLLILICFPFIIYSQYNKLAQPLTTKLGSQESFSASRAYQHLTELLEGVNSHPVDSQQNHLVADRIVSKLNKMNYDAQIQRSPSCVDSANGTAHCAMVKNIVVVIEGSQPERNVLLSAHYDSVAASPGASDAGTAVATLLTIAELLKNQTKPKNSVILLFNDGEEYGLLGARAFASESGLSDQLTDVINIDAIGTSGPSLLIETGKTSESLLHNFGQTSPIPIASSFISDIWSRIPSDTDMTIYKRYGLSGYNFINLETDPHYHTPQDNLKNVSMSSLQQHGDNTWNLLTKLLEEANIARPDNQSVVYSDLLGFSLIVLTLNEVFILTGICVFLWLISIWRLSKNQSLNLKSSLMSHFVCLLLIMIGGLSAVTIKKLSQVLLGSQEPWNQYFSVMQLFLLFSISAVVILFSHIWRFLSSRTDRLLALCTIYTGGLVLASLVYSQLAMLFLFVALISNFALLLNTSSVSTRIKLFSVFALFITACLSFLPALYHLQTMMKFYLSPAVGVLITLTILPSVILSSKTRGKESLFRALTSNTLMTAAIFTVLSLSCFIYIAANPIYSKSKPRDINLQLMVKEDDTPKILLTNNEVYELFKKYITPLNTATFDLPWSRTTLNGYQIENNERLDDLLKSLRSQVKVETDNNKKYLNLTTTKSNLAGLKVYIPSSSGLQSITYKSKRLNYSDDNNKYPDYYEFHCIGESCSELKLELNFLNDFSGDMWVTQIYHSLPESLSDLIELRNQYASQKAKGDQTVLVDRYSLR